MQTCKIKRIKALKHLDAYHGEVSATELKLKTHYATFFLELLLSGHKLIHVKHRYLKTVLYSTEKSHKVVLVKCAIA